MNEKTKTDEICCPEFDPKLMDGKTHTWENKLFIKMLFLLFCTCHCHQK